MLKLTAEMSSISNNRSNLSALFLKGPVQGEYLYEDISLRTSKYIDILISPRDISISKKLLIKLGYLEIDEPAFILNEHKLRNYHSFFTQTLSFQLKFTEVK